MVTNQNHIVIHPVTIIEDDVSDIVRERRKILKDNCFKLITENKEFVYYSNIRLTFFVSGDTDDVISMLEQLKIIEKSGYEKYRILIKDKGRIEEILENVNIYVRDSITYIQKIEHKLLGVYEVIETKNKDVLKELIDAQIAEWEFEWQMKEPTYILGNYKNILRSAIETQLNKDGLIDKSNYPIAKPDYPKLADFDREEPAAPQRKFWGVSKKEKLEYENAVDEWLREKNRIKQYNINLVEEYNIKKSKWENEFYNYIKSQSRYNSSVNDIFEKYDTGNTSIDVCNYFEFALKHTLSAPFSKDIKLVLEEDTKILKATIELPVIESFPNIKERIFVKTRNEFKDKLFTQKEIEVLFDDSIYQCILAVIHLIIKNDYKKFVEYVNINGWVNNLNRGTGQYEAQIVASILVSVQEFSAVNLELVEPKVCFKNFKGILGYKFSDVTPIKPVLAIDTSDTRFIDAVAVADKLNESTNLAAMDWEEFEYLIREIFEKEFSDNGGEVKVTQASKDGGVDAIAFDKDPIRGGKIVIQAKRYTNVVGVSAVRDLYGTVMNEGANKGILVTTSNFGADSYNFVKDKPLTLINGAELLYLLEKHGYKARIDIEEAKKQINAELK